MKIGHRRTASETLDQKLSEYSCHVQYPIQKKGPPIAKLIKASTNKVNKKITNVDLLNYNRQRDQGVIKFQFGKNNNFQSEKAIISPVQQYGLRVIPQNTKKISIKSNKIQKDYRDMYRKKKQDKKQDKKEQNNKSKKEQNNKRQKKTHSVSQGDRAIWRKPSVSNKETNKSKNLQKLHVQSLNRKKANNYSILKNSRKLQLFMTYFSSSKHKKNGVKL